MNKYFSDPIGTLRNDSALYTERSVMPKYKVRFIHSADAKELINLYHLARTALSGTGKERPYHRRLWASSEFHKAHPEVSSCGVYKDLDGLLA